MTIRFDGVIEDFQLLRTRHLRGEDLEGFEAAGFEGCHIDGARVELQRHGKPYAQVPLDLLPFFSGLLPLMPCPRCGACRAVLALHPSGIGCRGRECVNLTWRTKRQASQERRELRDYLKELLTDDWELCRPFRMRVKEFDALVGEPEWLKLRGSSKAPAGSDGGDCGCDRVNGT